MSIEVKVPVLPESVADATIASWHKKEGDSVRRDENLVDLETDKVVLEVPSPVDGKITAIKFAEGDTVESDMVLVTIEEGEVADEPAAAPAAEAPKAAAPATASSTPASTAGREDLSPAGRRVAAENNMDVSKVAGSGRGGRITKGDLLNHLAGGGNRQEERVPMTRIRKRIAERMMESKNSIAMLTSFNEIDLSAVKAMRKQLGESFEKEHEVRLGFMSFFVKAAANALLRYPVVNASTDGEDIIYHSYADISIAVSTERGLVTPVLRNVEAMSFADIETAVREYANKARKGGLQLEDLQGGTFTITNGGVFGSLMSTPIVNPPQSAILGMHTIKERPVAVNGEIKVAPMMYIALSYDHRIIDGKDAVQFLVDIKEQLENPHRMLLGLGG